MVVSSADYPINDRLQNWVFRIHVVSAGAYRAEGIDHHGRCVSCEDSSAQLALDRCVSMAKGIAKACN